MKQKNRIGATKTGVYFVKVEKASQFNSSD